MKTYCIKPDYQHRTENATVETQEGQYWTAERLDSMRYNQYHVYLEAARLVRQRGLKRVLDVGCGPAYKLVHMVEPVAQEVVGVDQATAIDVAQRLYPQSRTRFVTVDLEQSGETGLGKFDLIICADVIEHLLDPDVLLSFIRQHCHAQTYVMISTPERDVRRGRQNMRSPKAEHVREWNREELRAYLTASGFRVEQQPLVPAFRIGWSPKYIHERVRLIRKRIPYRYNQVAVARLA